jgi:hypothetical protein
LKSLKHATQATLLLLTTWTAFAPRSGDASPAGDQPVWAPPQADWPETLPEPTVAKELVKGLRVAGFPITLEKTKLDQAQRRFGGIIGSRGDASGYLAWLCLRGDDNEGKWVLWLYSGEINGPVIGGFQWQRVSPELRLDRRCTYLDSRNGPVELPVQLRLDMTEAEVDAGIGPPSSRYRDSAIYSYERSLTLHNEPYTLRDDVLIMYRGGKVSVIAVNHLTSD